MVEPVAIDLDWLTDHPLPTHPYDSDKDDRGHVVVVGGSGRVPGGVRLTGEAALRVGAGRLHLAVPERLAIPLGLALPEAGIIAMAETEAGEIGGELPADFLKAIGRCDSLVVGPAMANREAAGPLVEALLACELGSARLVIDAAGIGSLGTKPEAVRRFANRAVVTPNGGEMAGLLGCEIDEVMAAPDAAASKAVERLGIAVILKGPRSLIATPDGELLSYSGESIGLATSGSGDVLAGILGGLLARGVPLRDACAWAVWLHGEAGRRLSEDWGPVGFLARELLQLVPRLIRARR